MTGLPVMTSGWSGQIDFLSKENSLLLPGELQKVPKSAVWKDIIIDESQSYKVDENALYKAFTYTFESSQEFKSKSKELMRINQEKFTLNKMTEKLDIIMEKYIKNIPSEVSLNLPKLKKVKNEEPNEVKLPKLKKLV